MRIENDVKLDFSDVLIRPKRSTLTSRKEVILERTFSFPHAEGSWTGIPLVAANMDGVGTIAMMESFAHYHMQPPTFEQFDGRLNRLLFNFAGRGNNAHSVALGEVGRHLYLPLYYQGGKKQDYDR